MADVPTQSEHTTSLQRSRWPVAFTLTTLVAVPGLIAASQQFIVKYLWDESAHIRTVGGTFFMLLGVFGVALPLCLIRSKRRFANLSSKWQWLIAIGLPLTYLLAFTACFYTMTRSTTLILPRPFTPTAVVHYNPSDPNGWRTTIEFGNALRDHHPAQGYDNDGIQNGIESFKALFYQGYLHYPRQQTTTIDGTTRKTDDGTIEITLDVATVDRLQFDVIGLDNVAITADGESIRESNAKAGKYKVVITGHPTKDK